VTFGASDALVVLMPVADNEHDVVTAWRFVDDQQVERQAECLSEAQQSMTHRHHHHHHQTFAVHQSMTHIHIVAPAATLVASETTSAVQTLHDYVRCPPRLSSVTHH